MTRLQWFNYYIFQWFFFRITRIGYYYLWNDTFAQDAYGIMFPIVPGSGWGRDYQPTWYIRRRILKWKKTVKYHTPGR